MAYIAQRQFLVTCTATELGTGYWTQKSGGNSAVDSTKVYGGGSPAPAIVTGITNVENLTLARAYDSTRDGPILTTIRGMVGELETGITVQEVDRNYSATGKPKAVYSGCLLVGVSEPEYDSAGGEPAMLQLEFAVSSVTSG